MKNEIFSKRFKDGLSIIHFFVDWDSPTTIIFYSISNLQNEADLLLIICLNLK